MVSGTTAIGVNYCCGHSTRQDRKVKVQHCDTSLKSFKSWEIYQLDSPLPRQLESWRLAAAGRFASVASGKWLTEQRPTPLMPWRHLWRQCSSICYLPHTPIFFASPNGKLAGWLRWRRFPYPAGGGNGTSLFHVCHSIADLSTTVSTTNIGP